MKPTLLLAVIHFLKTIHNFPQQTLANFKTGFWEPRRVQ